jgi:hypothetical protein
MIRSASTWSFNVVKQLVSRTSDSVVGGYADAVAQAMRQHGLGADHLIIKCHQPDDVARAMIRQRLCRTIYTFREPLGAILSEGSEPEASAARIKASLELLRFQIEAGGVRCLWYDDIVADPLGCVQAIADYVQLDLPATAVAEVAERLSRENVRRVIREQGKSSGRTSKQAEVWDTGTLFHDHHIHDHPGDPAKVYSAAQVARIAACIGPEFVDAGAALHPAIRALGALDWRPDGPRRSWPAPDAEIAAAPAADTPVPDPDTPASAADTPAPEAAADAPADAAPVAEPAAPADAAPAAEPAAPADAAPAAEPAAPADPAPQPAAASASGTPPATSPPAAAASKAATAAPKPAAPAPKHAAFDPAAIAERRALADQLLRSLGPAAARRGTGKSRRV